MAIHNRPAWHREFAYAEASFFSGTADDFSAVGLSGLYNDLSGVADHYYVIWGWQSAYVFKSGSGKKHLILELEDEDGKRVGIMHGSSDDNTAIMLPQPLRLKTGSGVYWEVLDTDMSGDSIVNEVYYTLVKEN
jgi:hypothetical protein